MIQVKDNAIPKDKLRACEMWLEKANWSYGWASNKDMPFGHWNVDISKTGITNPTEIKDRLPKEFKEVWKSINTEFFKGQAILTRCYANRHTFGTEGYIHTDTERQEDHTVVVYMNSNWDTNWGGETVFYSKDKSEVLKAVIPSYGRVVAFQGNINHKAAALSRVCPTVRTTLMFKASIDPKAVYPAEEMLDNFLREVGANKRPHKNGTLADHLVRVFHILKSVEIGRAHV